LPGGERFASGLEVPVVGRGNANEINAPAQELLDSVRSRTTDEWSDPLGGGLSVALGARAGPTGNGGERDVDRPEVAPVQRFGVQLLEDGAVSLVEDHAEADHTDSQAFRGKLAHAGHDSSADLLDNGRFQANSSKTNCQKQGDNLT